MKFRARCCTIGVLLLAGAVSPERSDATAVVLLLRPHVVAFAADSSAEGTDGKHYTACKLFSNGHTALSVGGVVLGTKHGNWYDLGSVFREDSAFAGEYSEHAFLQAANGWGAKAADCLKASYQESPAFRLWPHDNCDGVGFFVGVTRAKQLVVVSEQIKETGIVNGRTEYSVIGTLLPVPPLGVRADYGFHVGDVDEELAGQKTIRSHLQQPLIQALKQSETPAELLDAGTRYIDLVESWYPAHAAGIVTALHVTPAGVVWDHPCNSGVSKDPRRS